MCPIESEPLVLEPRNIYLCSPVERLWNKFILVTLPHRSGIIRKQETFGEILSHSPDWAQPYCGSQRMTKHDPFLP